MGDAVGKHIPISSLSLLWLYVYMTLEMYTSRKGVLRAIRFCWTCEASTRRQGRTSLSVPCHRGRCWDRRRAAALCHGLYSFVNVIFAFIRTLISSTNLCCDIRILEKCLDLPWAMTLLNVKDRIVHSFTLA